MNTVNLHNACINNDVTNLIDGVFTKFIQLKDQAKPQLSSALKWISYISRKRQPWETEIICALDDSCRGIHIEKHIPVKGNDTYFVHLTWWEWSDDSKAIQFYPDSIANDLSQLWMLDSSTDIVLKLSVTNQIYQLLTDMNDYLAPMIRLKRKKIDKNTSMHTDIAPE